MKTIAVITPTLSRPTLHRALTSAELAPGDEWIVVGDGPQPEAQHVVEALGATYRYVEGPLTRNHGNEQRDLGMALASADCIAFLDDDDVFEPGALGLMRPYLEVGWPVIFRMRHNGHVIWQSQELWPGEVGGCMFCVPNDKARLGRWGDDDGQASDLEFIKATLGKWDQVVWAGEVIVRCSPDE